MYTSRRYILWYGIKIYIDKNFSIMYILIRFVYTVYTFMYILYILLCIYWIYFLELLLLFIYLFFFFISSSYGHTNLFQFFTEFFERFRSCLNVVKVNNTYMTANRNFVRFAQSYWNLNMLMHKQNIYCKFLYILKCVLKIHLLNWFMEMHSGIYFTKWRKPWSPTYVIIFCRSYSVKKYWMTNVSQYLVSFV